MKRRGFLGLLGLAPAVPLIAKELVKAESSAPVPLPPERTVRFEKRVDHALMVTAGHYVSVPHEYSSSYTAWAALTDACPYHNNATCHRCETCDEWHCSLNGEAHLTWPAGE